MQLIGVIGGTRGLGKALVDLYAKEPHTIVCATARYDAPQDHPQNVRWLSNIDITNEKAGRNIAAQYSGQLPLDVVYITAGLFELETFEEPKWDAEVKMYTISAIGPVFLIKHLVDGKLLKEGSKIVLISSEAGSIALRTEKEGGGNCMLSSHSIWTMC
jgi:NAD(P)-dependent dehydrogenase (short-subunit alcohol dehydrogenase family)